MCAVKILAISNAALSTYPIGPIWGCSVLIPLLTLSARDLLTDFSGGRTLDECGVAQSSSSELATQRLPSQP